MVFSSYFDSTESKLLGFAGLKDGWHYRDGKAFTEGAINDCIILHRQIFFKGFTRTNAFPGPNGEIQVTVYYDQHYFQFERESSGLWNITHEVNDEEVEFAERKEFSQVVNYVNGLNAKLCDTSDVYSRLIGTPIEGGSTTWLLNAQKAVFPSLGRIACLQRDQQYAST